MNPRITETLGMLMIGDGVASVLEPKRHCMLWQVGPRPLRSLIEEFIEHPRLTRAFGLVELLAGVFLARRADLRAVLPGQAAQRLFSGMHR